MTGVQTCALPISAGMDDYISKPISMTKLKETLKKYLLKDVKVEYIEEESEDLKVLSTTDFSIWDEKEALARLGGSQKILNKILEIFLVDIDKQISMFKNSIDLHDLQNCELSAHTIKGSAANVSAKKLQNVAKELEKIVKDGDTKKLKKGLALLENNAKEVVDILKEYLKNIKEDDTKIIKISIKELVSILNTLKEQLEEGAFIDTEIFDIFKADFNKKIVDNLAKLKKEINHFNSSKAIEIIDEAIQNIDI